MSSSKYMRNECFCTKCGNYFFLEEDHRCPTFSPMKIVDEYYAGRATRPVTDKIVSDGGPSSYYDFPTGANTLNDLLEYKGDTQWLGDSFHLSNVVKAAWRWGDKEGTTKEYDARKFIYSGCRLLMKYAGVSAVRKTLQAMLDDPQFQERDKT
jgi:hypothetical protein